MSVPTEVSDGVFVSDIAGAERYDDEFEHILSLTLDEPDVDSVHAPIQDGENEQIVFDNAVRLASEMIEDDGNVLVHCNAGISRSPAVVITALASIDDRQFGDVRSDVAESKPNIVIHSELQKHAKRFLDEADSIYKNPF